MNPAAGLTFTPSRGLNAYIGYSEGSRAPTSIELGCADPDQPCKLPNSLAGDPPLDQVVTHTWEAGVRGGSGPGFNWSVGAFRSANKNDILFVTSSETGFGYFKNFGETLRQGVELNVNGRISRVTLGGGYTFLDATYQSSETVDGSGNSTNDSALAGIPGIPTGPFRFSRATRFRSFPGTWWKAFADVRVTSKSSGRF